MFQSLRVHCLRKQKDNFSTIAYCVLKRWIWKYTHVLRMMLRQFSTWFNKRILINKSNVIWHFWLKSVYLSSYSKNSWPLHSFSCRYIPLDIWRLVINRQETVSFDDGTKDILFSELSPIIDFTTVLPCWQVILHPQHCGTAFFDYYFGNFITGYLCFYRNGYSPYHSLCLVCFR